MHLSLLGFPLSLPYPSCSLPLSLEINWGLAGGRGGALRGGTPSRMPETKSREENKKLRKKNAILEAAHFVLEIRKYISERPSGESLRMYLRYLDFIL